MSDKISTPWYSNPELTSPGEIALALSQEFTARVKYNSHEAILKYNRKNNCIILERRDDSHDKVITILKIPAWSVINVESLEESYIREMHRYNDNAPWNALEAGGNNNNKNKKKKHKYSSYSPFHRNSNFLSDINADSINPHSRVNSLASHDPVNNASSSSETYGANSNLTNCVYYLHYSTISNKNKKNYKENYKNHSSNNNNSRSKFCCVCPSCNAEPISTIEFTSLSEYQDAMDTRQVIHNILTTIYPRGAKRLFLFVSPTSGPGNAIKICQRHVLPILHYSRHELEVIVTTRAHHCEDYIANISNNIDNHYVIVCVGGDGIVHEAVNGLHRRRMALLNNSSNNNNNNNNNNITKKEKNSIKNEKKSFLNQLNLYFPTLSYEPETSLLPMIATVPAGSGCGMAKTLNVIKVKESVLALVHLDSCVKDLMSLQYIPGVMRDNNNNDRINDTSSFTHLLLNQENISCNQNGSNIQNNNNNNNNNNIVAERIACMSTSFGLVNQIDHGSEKLRWMGNSRFTAYAVYTFIKGLRTYKMRVRYLPWEGDNNNNNNNKIQKLQGEIATSDITEFPRCTLTRSCLHCKAHNNINNNNNNDILESTGSISSPTRELSNNPLTLQVNRQEVDFNDSTLPWVTLDGNYLNIFLTNVRDVAKDVNIAPLAHLSDGAIDFIYNMNNDEVSIGRGDFLKFFTGLEKGNHIGLDCVGYIKVRAIELEALEGFLMCDGEVMPFKKVQMTSLRQAAEFVRGL